MKTDRYTKVVLTFIAVGLFLNIAINLPVQPAFAQSVFPDSYTVHHTGTIKIDNYPGESFKIKNY